MKKQKTRKLENSNDGNQDEKGLPLFVSKEKRNEKDRPSVPERRQKN